MMAGIPLRHTEQNTETVMLTVRFPENIERRLDRLARATGRTKSFYMREALLRYLDEVKIRSKPKKPCRACAKGGSRCFRPKRSGRCLTGKSAAGSAEFGEEAREESGRDRQVFGNSSGEALASPARSCTQK